MSRSLLSLLAMTLLTLSSAGCSAPEKRDDLWSVTGTFAGCPARPSCVSSMATDRDRKVAPFSYQESPEEARARLIAAIQAMPGAVIEDRQRHYLHAVFVSKIMRFRDDVELLIQADGVIQVRSLSRIGYYDFGVNRERVENLRRAFESLRE